MAVATTVANGGYLSAAGGGLYGTTAAADVSVYRGGTTGSLTIAGASSGGASITLYSGSHASRADEIRMLQGSALVLQVASGGVCHFGQSGQFPIHNFNINTTTAVGAAGGATALPATPEGYLRLAVNGTEKRVPFYPTT